MECLEFENNMADHGLPGTCDWIRDVRADTSVSIKTAWSEKKRKIPLKKERYDNQP
jgi:hypothetical protein